MKISVITVCFNSKSTVSQTLQSVEGQSWPWIEHIVIDGGSTDGTCDILEAHRSRLAHLVSEPDDGIYDAMNKGIQRATGDVICFLNSDDHYVHRDVLSHIAVRMQERDLDALFGDVAFFKAAHPDKVVRYYRSASFHPNRLAWGWMPAHPSLFMKREIYEELGGFKSDYRIAGDFEFIARAFTARPIRYEYMPEVLVKMQSGGISTASGFMGRVLHNNELLRACRDNGILTNILKIFSRYPLKLLECIIRR